MEVDVSPLDAAAPDDGGAPWEDLLLLLRAPATVSPALDPL
jgi:hypothetical protein